MGTKVEYKPIDGPDTIRLLRLLKGNKYYDDTIRCELFEAPLPRNDDTNDESYYDALSYTWGSELKTGEIVINGKTATVTANLHQALRHLRYVDEDRILWVDAVCINQENHAERTHQVGKMCNIYKKAKEVIIWLGKTTKEVDLLLDDVELLDKKMLRRSKPRNGSDPLDNWLNEARRFLKDLDKRNPAFYSMKKRGLEDLLARSWWCRIWVVQEAANAPRARIQCSWRSVPTRTFALMPILMEFSTGTREKALLEVMPGPLRKQSWWRSDRCLSTLLQKFDSCQSTEERDQIYALLGISSEAATLDCPLQADYSLGMPEVTRNTLSFLAFGEILDPARYDLPPWNLNQLRNALPSLKPSLFEWALRVGNVALTQKLLQQQTPGMVNEKLPCDRLPLHFVISLNSPLDLVRILLECKDLDVNLSDSDSYFTPLSLAASEGRVEIVRLLLAQPGTMCRLYDPCLKTPVERAIEGRHTLVTDLLVSQDKELLKDEGERLLHLAIKNNSGPDVSLLLEKGVNPNALVHDNTALLVAVECGYLDIIRLLLSNGADPNLGPRHSPPLKVAVMIRSLDLARVLLDEGQGTDVDVRDGDGETPLVAATRSGDCDMVRFLRRRGADIEAKTCGGLSVFWLAVLHGFPEIMELLTDLGADITVSKTLHPCIWEGTTALCDTPIMTDFLQKRNITPADTRPTNVEGYLPEIIIPSASGTGGSGK